MSTDLYGTPWGEVLTDTDRPFVQSIVDSPPRHTIRRPAPSSPSASDRLAPEVPNRTHSATDGPGAARVL